MRVGGTLSKWNDERGFGFIAPDRGGPEVFVHVSLFPNDGVRPAVGERLSFEIETDNSGKKRARNLFCPDRRIVVRPSKPPPRRHASNHGRQRRGFSGRALSLLAVIGLGAYGYSNYSHQRDYSEEVVPRTEIQEPTNEFRESTREPLELTPTFHCDGRTHCSQMTSCAEAIYFLENCPNVQMDGNRDGEPCEQQWCN